MNGPPFIYYLIDFISIKQCLLLIEYCKDLFEPSPIGVEGKVSICIYVYIV